MTNLLRICAILSLLIAEPIVAGENDDNAAVMKIVDMFFTAMSAKDVAAMRAVMLPEGLIHGYRQSAGDLELVHLTHNTYLHNLTMSEEKLVERYWDPTILTQERIATVWTYYDLYRDDEFSHCGINNFSFLKTDDGWKIAGVVFSMQIEDCPDSPLGPYQADNRSQIETVQ
jgi:hypothetical protein